MIKASRYILYLFVFLLACGNNFYSGSSHSPTLRLYDEHVGQESYAFIDDADFIDLIEEAFPYLVEEFFSSESQDDGSDDGKVFGPEDGLQHRWSLPLTDSFHIAHTFIPSLPFTGKATPLYLLHRVFRI